MVCNITLKQRAYADILGRILDGRYASGDLLNRRGVAKELKMSPAPVHEAMIQLEQDDLLEALPRHGTRVRTTRKEDVRGHLVVREALECQAARMICGERLRRNLRNLKELALKADLPSPERSFRLKHEVSFHIALVELAECPVLLREYSRVMRVGLFYQINLLIAAPFDEPPLNRHLALLEGLCIDTPAKAEERARRHIWSGKTMRIMEGDY